MSDAVNIIAEGEINHNGDVALAKKLVDAAHECGADMIKFQCFVTDSFIAPGSSFLPIFRENELSLDEFRQIRDHAEDVGITMISTAGDLDGLAMIVDLDLPVIKVGSTNITHISLLRAIAATGKPVYLSTGASTIDEIRAALDILQSGGSGPITLFHCTVQYPAEDDVLNLRSIVTMQKEFPDMAIGFSDHSQGSLAAAAAAALGATVFEKHFTLDNDMPGPDHGFSADPKAFAEYVGTIRSTERMLGSAAKEPTAAEEAVRLNGRRYLTAMTDIPAGSRIEAPMIRPRRIDASVVDPKTLLGPDMEESLSGATAARQISAGTAITPADIEAT